MIVAFATVPNTVHVFNAETHEDIFKFNSDESVQSLAFDPTGKILLVRNYLKLVIVDVRSMLSTSSMTFDNLITSVVFHPSGDKIAVGLADGRVFIKILTVSDCPTICSFKVDPPAHDAGNMADPVRGIEVSADGERVFTAGRDGYVKVWSFTSGELVNTFGPGQEIFYMCQSPDGNLIATFSRTMFGAQYTVWRSENGEMVKQSEHLGIRCQYFMFVDNDTIVLTSGEKVFRTPYSHEEFEDITTSTLLYGKLCKVTNSPSAIVCFSPTASEAKVQIIDLTQGVTPIDSVLYTIPTDNHLLCACAIIPFVVLL
jgi:WD40 repeat protein